MTTFRPLGLSAQLYSELKHRILTCAIPPGQRLVEKDLCDELNVSRTSLREALTRLSHDSLVIQVPNRGYTVAEITLDRFKALCELRRVVEPQVVNLATKRASREQLAAIRKAATFTIADPDVAALEYCRANFAFHSAIARVIKNEFLEDIVVSALEKDQQPIYHGIDLEVCTNAEDITREHTAIVDAMEAGDADHAEALMAAHIGKKEYRILNALGKIEGKG